MKSFWLPVFVFATIAVLALTQARSGEPESAAASAADPMLGKEPGQVRDDNGLKMQFVWCPPGIFTMEGVELIEEPAETGDKPGNDDIDDVGPDNEPATKKDRFAIQDKGDLRDAPSPRMTTRIKPVKVLLTNGYWLGKYEVTQSEWKKLMPTDPWKDQKLIKEGPDYPATLVSWDDAMNFCRKLTEQEQKAGRLPTGWEFTLPTEAQWERGCRAGTETRFSFGDDESKLGDYAWFSANASNAGENFAHRVGRKKANPWGLCDMHGNVWEWCRDVYAPDLPGGRDPEVKPVGERRDAFRVYRGGCWFSVVASCRPGSRYNYLHDDLYHYLGFRAALSPVRSDK